MFARRLSTAHHISPYMIFGSWEPGATEESPRIREPVAIANRKVAFVMDSINAAAFIDLCLRGPTKLSYRGFDSGTELFYNVLCSVFSSIFHDLDGGEFELLSLTENLTPLHKVQSATNGCEIYIQIRSGIVDLADAIDEPWDLNESYDGQVFIPDIATIRPLKLYNLVRDEYPPLQFSYIMRLGPQEMRTILGYYSEHELANFFYFAAIIDLIGPAVLKPLEVYAVRKAGITATEPTNKLYRPISRAKFAWAVFEYMMPHFPEAFRILDGIHKDIVDQIKTESDADPLPLN